jgi:hypothetical protein
MVVMPVSFSLVLTLAPHCVPRLPTLHCVVQYVEIEMVSERRWAPVPDSDESDAFEEAPVKYTVECFPIFLRH